MIHKHWCKVCGARIGAYAGGACSDVCRAEVRSAIPVPTYGSMTRADALAVLDLVGTLGTGWPWRALRSEVAAFRHDWVPGPLMAKVMAVKRSGAKPVVTTIPTAPEQTTATTKPDWERDTVDAERTGATIWNWRRYSDEAKRGLVSDWHKDQTVARGDGVYPRLVPGAKWPLSTLDMPELACTKRAPMPGHSGALLFCDSPAGHPGECGWALEVEAAKHAAAVARPGVYSEIRFDDQPSAAGLRPFDITIGTVVRPINCLEPPPAPDYVEVAMPPITPPPIGPGDRVAWRMHTDGSTTISRPKPGLVCTCCPVIADWSLRHAIVPGDHHGTVCPLRTNARATIGFI